MLGTLVGKGLRRCDVALWPSVAVERGAGAGAAVGRGWRCVVLTPTCVGKRVKELSCARIVDGSIDARL